LDAFNSQLVYEKEKAIPKKKFAFVRKTNQKKKEVPQEEKKENNGE